MTSGDSLWWLNTIIYQVYPRSFMDSSGSGVGDLQGVTSRLSHLQYLGVDTLWISPVYPSPMVDFGYDVQDFCDIEPTFGNMEDFDELVRELHGRGMRLVMDFIPNHSSDRHAWFTASRRGGIHEDNPYRDFYLWHPGHEGADGERQPPSNWMSVFGGSAWTWCNERQEFYYHRYSVEQPDLNYRCAELRSCMRDVLQFWLDKGVDGFRVDAIKCLVEVEDVTADEPFCTDANHESVGYDSFDHIHTLFQQKTYEVVREWRQLFDDHEKKTGHRVLMITEAYPIDDDIKTVMKFFDYGADIPFNFNLTRISEHFTGHDILAQVELFVKNCPSERAYNFVLGNHDRRRVASRKGRRYVNAFNTLLLMLPGIATTYQGEEIGMEDISLTYEQTQDSYGRNMGEERYAQFSRDPCRSPMQWSDSHNAGFSAAATTWLPIHSNYPRVNVDSQVRSANPSQPVQVYRRLSQLRRTALFGNSSLRYHVVTDDVFSFLSNVGGDALALVVINVGEDCVVDVGVDVGEGRVDEGRVLVDGSAVPRGEGARVGLAGLRLAAGDALVVGLRADGQ